MVISNDPFAPVFVVVGSTGQQGASVIKAIEASATPYRVRALTRDASKPAAKALQARGIEVVSADTSQSGDVKIAFAGATFVFAMTLPNDQEIVCGKNQLDAAKAAGVKVVVWAGLPSLSAQTDGKYPAFSFDQKAEVTAYARTIASPTFRVIDVQPPSYISNYWMQFLPQKKVESDGTVTWVFALPCLPSETTVPMIDLDEDYGEYVVGALERGHETLETVYASPEYSTLLEQGKIMSRVLGKNVVLTEFPREQFVAVFAPMHLPLFGGVVGEYRAGQMANTGTAIALAGYWAGADLTESNKILRTPARTFEQAVIANKEKFEAVMQ